MNNVALFFRGLLLAALIFSGKTLAASAVLVWPVYQIIEADRQGSALWLENRGSAPVNLQVRVLSWRQQENRDRYADQQTVIASPPFASVAPGQRQLIRLVRSAPVAAGSEQAFRIVIDELPAQQPAEMKQHAGLQLQMRYLLPLFVDGEGIWTQARADMKRDPATAARPRLSWRIVQQQGKQWLQLSNQGIVHARLSNVFWGSSGNPQQASLMLARGFLGYVLPGQQMRFPLPQQKSAPLRQTLYAQLADNTAPVALAAAP